jgi:hypothetical protein
MKTNPFSSQNSRIETADRFYYGAAQPVRSAIKLLLPVVLLLMCMACGNRVIMKADIEGEPLNAKPSSTPLPNPPQDNFSWGSIDVTAKVVAGNGGNWVMVTPVENYFSTGKYRAFVLNAFTDAITTGKTPAIRGALTVNMNGFGTMVVSLYAFQAVTNTSNPLGGFLIRNVGIPGIGYMTVQNLKVMETNNSILNSTGLSPYTSGQPVQLNWSIDQGARTTLLTATPAGGAQKSASVTYDPIITNGVSNTPIQKVLVIVELFEAQRGISVFFDNFSAEEF